MHPDLHTDLDNLDSVENNLRHSAKGSNDAYDVTFSLTVPPSHKRNEALDDANVWLQRGSNPADEPSSLARLFSILAR